MMNNFFIQHKKEIGLIIAILNLLSIVNSTRVFLLVMGFPVAAWLCFNACAPSVAIYLAGFFSGKRPVMAASLPFLFFFGGVGLLMFGWSGDVLVAQAGHIMMACAILYTIIIITLEKSWKKSMPGLIAGVALLLVILPLQQKFMLSHPEYLEKLGHPGFERMMKGKMEY
jgi:hypothetical protein